MRPQDDGTLTVGPDSVGHRIQTQALVFGGSVPTATDYTVAIGRARIGQEIEPVVKKLQHDTEKFDARVKVMLERIIDTMKTSPEDIPVLLVGGGAAIAPSILAGASRVIKPSYGGVANAIGAAIAKVRLFFLSASFTLTCY